jgi:hypothetical protein
VVPQVRCWFLAGRAAGEACLVLEQLRSPIHEPAATATNSGATFRRDTLRLPGPVSAGKDKSDKDNQEEQEPSPSHICIPSVLAFEQK